jgi:hypothetical protein
MKTLITTLAVLALSFTSVIAKDGTFTSVIVNETDHPLQLNLRAREWLKITNFVQNGGNTDNSAGIALFKGDESMWILFANQPQKTDAPVIVAGPATLMVWVPSNEVKAFLTYQRGSD